MLNDIYVSFFLSFALQCSSRKVVRAMQAVQVINHCIYFYLQQTFIFFFYKQSFHSLNQDIEQHTVDEDWLEDWWIMMMMMWV